MNETANRQRNVRVSFKKKKVLAAAYHYNILVSGDFIDRNGRVGYRPVYLYAVLRGRSRYRNVISQELFHKGGRQHAARAA